MSRPEPHALLTVGALGIAVMTALEVLTAPYSDAVRAYPLNGAVHVVKVVAVLVLCAGLVGWSRSLTSNGERLAAGATAVLAAVTAVGAVPYSLIEASLDGGLAPAAANARLESIYAEQTWVGATASVALPITLIAVVVLAVAGLRRGLLPRWAPLASLAAIPVAVLAAVLTEAGWAVPHPPAWLFLGLAVYGPALARRAAPADRMPAAA